MSTFRGEDQFLAPKSNTTGGIGGLFGKMVGYYQYRRDDFLKHHHQRSNVESTFSAVKRKSGDAVRSRTDVAMANEVLAELVCLNLTRVILSQVELGIEAGFPGLRRGSIGHRCESTLLAGMRGQCPRAPGRLGTMRVSDSPPTPFPNDARSGPAVPSRIRRQRPATDLARGSVGSATRPPTRAPIPSTRTGDR